MTILGVESDTSKPSSSARRHKLVSQDPRGRRYELRSALLREYGTEVREVNKTLCECGGPLMVENGVVVRRTADSAGYAGVKSCARASVCPVCAAKIGAQRAAEISEVVDLYQDRSGSVAMVTLTMRHRQDQSLSHLWQALSDSWKAATNGRRWRKERQEYGIDGYCRAVETTHGKNGWHLHIHALFFFDQELSDEAIHQLSLSMYDRWSRKLEDCGLEAPLFRWGIDWKRVSTKPNDESGDVLGKYLTKIASGVGFEVGASMEKTGRRVGHRSPWEIAQGAVSGEDEKTRQRDMAIWLEWLAESKSRIMFRWSTGFRKALGLDQELTEEEAAAKTIDGDAVALIPARSWGIMRTQYADLLGDILRLAEAGHGWQNLASMVRRRDARLVIEPAPDVVARWCAGEDRYDASSALSVEDAASVLPVLPVSRRRAVLPVNDAVSVSPVHDGCSVCGEPMDASVKPTGRHILC